MNNVTSTSTSWQPRVKASDIPLERLSTNPELTENQKSAEVSRQFESLLLRQIITEANKTVFKSSLTDNSLAQGVYQDMITTQMADNISKSGNFGLAQTFQEQLTSQVSKKAPAQASDSATVSVNTSPLKPHDRQP